MGSPRNAPRPSTRLNKGADLLAYAQKVDTKALKPRLDAFFDMHRRYLEAQAEVDAAAALERAELRHVKNLDAAHDRALNELAAALLLDGEPRRNPFARFSERGPGRISGLGFAQKVKVTHDLEAAMRCSSGVSETALAAAGKAEQAAVRVEEALPGRELRRGYLAVVRARRDNLVPQWDTAYRALRLLSESTVEDSDLHATLFPRTRRRGKKAVTADQPAVPAALPQAAADAAVQHPTNRTGSLRGRGFVALGGASF